MSSKPIFISHAVADKDIAVFVTDMLSKMSINVADLVFCSSVDGLGIPQGVKFRDFIRSQIQDPTVVILIVSKQYLASQFCVAEMGAAWALAHHTIPVFVPPSKYDDIKSVMEGVQSCTIDCKTGWNYVADTMASKLGFKPNHTYWEAARDRQLEGVSALISSRKDNETVSRSDYDSLKSEAIGLARKVLTLEEQVSKLKDLKDSVAVATVLKEYTETWEEFEVLCADARGVLRMLHDFTQKAIFLTFRGLEIIPPKFDEVDANDSLRRAIEDDELSDDLGIALVTSNEEIRRARKAIDEIKEFLEASETPFVEWYRDQYGRSPNINSELFWRTHLYG